MNNFFISTEMHDNKFVGVIYNKNTNTKIYQSQSHAIQQNAIDEASTYLRTLTVPQTTPKSNNSFQPLKRCCGR
jgi:hypothetical protein